MSAAEPSQAQLLAAFDDAPCGLARTTASGTFLRVNRTFCTWLGYRSDELLGKRRLQDLLTMGGRIFHQTHWAPLLQMQGSISEVKLELVHIDGSLVPMVLNALQRSEEAEVVHEIAAFVARDRDIYERELIQSRKRLEALVTEATRLQAEARDHALAAEMMVGIVSHDLRNPMSSIQMATALLAKGASTSQQRTLDRIARSTSRANALIADLLDFTQARLGRGLAVAPHPLDLHGAVGAAVDDLTLAYLGRQLAHVRVGEGTCSADANRLSQLVGNLVSNAMTYGDPLRPVTVTSSIGEQMFSVTVHNFGKPIASEIQGEIFRPMSRGTLVTDASRSVGLGLFIVSEIAKAHRGTAHVSSSAEGGTTFSVVCPRA